MKTALLSNNPQFRAFASSIDTGIIVINTDGIIIDFNDATREMFGYSDEEIRGQPITMLMPERFEDWQLDEIKKYKKFGRSKMIGPAIRLYGVEHHGKEFPIEIHTSAWKDIDGLEYFTISIRRYSELENNLSKILISAAVISTLMLIALVVLAVRTFYG